MPDIVLDPGVDVKIWSGPGTNDNQNIYVGRTSLVWDAKNGMSVGVVDNSLLSGHVELYFVGGQSCYPVLGPPIPSPRVPPQGEGERTPGKPPSP